MRLGANQSVNCRRGHILLHWCLLLLQSQLPRLLQDSRSSLTYPSFLKTTSVLALVVVLVPDRGEANQSRGQW